MRVVAPVHPVTQCFPFRFELVVSLSARCKSRRTCLSAEQSQARTNVRKPPKIFGHPPKHFLRLRRSIRVACKQLLSATIHTPRSLYCKPRCYTRAARCPCHTCRTVRAAQCAPHTAPRIALFLLGAFTRALLALERADSPRAFDNLAHLADAALRTSPMHRAACWRTR